MHEPRDASDEAAMEQHMPSLLHRLTPPALGVAAVLSWPRAPPSFPRQACLPAPSWSRSQMPARSRLRQTRRVYPPHDTPAGKPGCLLYTATFDPTGLVGDGPVAAVSMLDTVQMPNGASYAVGWFAAGGLHALAIQRSGGGQLKTVAVLGDGETDIVKFHALAARANGEVWAAGSKVKPGAKLPSPLLAIVSGTSVQQRALLDINGETNGLAQSETVAGKNVAWQLRVNESGTASCK